MIFRHAFFHGDPHPANILHLDDARLGLVDFGLGQPFARSDYDASGSVGANDLTLWLLAFGSEAQGQSCPNPCP